MVYKIRVKQNWLSDFLFGTLEKLRQKNRKGWNKKKILPLLNQTNTEKSNKKKKHVKVLENLGQGSYLWPIDFFFFFF